MFEILMFSLRPLCRGVLYNFVNRVSFYVSCRVTFLFRVICFVPCHVILWFVSCRVVLFVLYDRVVSCHICSRYEIRVVSRPFLKK